MRRRPTGVGKVSGATAYRVQARLEEAYTSHFYHVRAFQLPIEVFSRLCVESDTEWKLTRLPGAARGYLDGFRRGLWKALWNYADWRLFWRGQYYHKAHTVGSTALYPDLRLVDHLLHGTSKPDTGIETGTWSEVQNENSRHFWLGGDRFFTEDRVEPANVQKEGE